MRRFSSHERQVIELIVGASYDILGYVFSYFACIWRQI